MKHTVEELIKHLAEETKGTVDIRYINGHFCVMCERGNFMSTVSGTRKVTMREAVEAAILRWDTRSEDNLFFGRNPYWDDGYSLKGDI